MHRRARRLILVAAVGAAATLFGACGGGDGKPKARAAAAVPREALPATILDLAVSDENATKLMEGSAASYIDRIGLFSLRRDELLQATLQVSHFSDEADWKEGNFRRKVARQVLEAGAELPTYRMGTTTVHLAVGIRQTTAVWFDGPYMFVMAAREEYEQPRALLRELVKLEMPA